MHRIDGANTSPTGHFSDGDPMVPRLPTSLNAAICESWQEEIAKPIEIAGLTLKTSGTETNDQLLSAMRLMGAAQNDAPFKGSAHAGPVRKYQWVGIDGTNGTRLDFTINAAWNGTQWVPDVSTSPSILLRMAAGASGGIIGASANIAVFRNDSGAAFAESAWSRIVNGQNGFSFATHWSNNGAPHPNCTYQVGIDGQVRLMGVALNDGTLGDVATLPAGARPASTLILPALYNAGGDWLQCWIQIDTTGLITATAPSPGTLTSARLALNGITFMVAP
jgi:hypothetical protein